MLLPHAGRPGVQRWDQGSLVTFASTGAVQPLTCCRVEFPPLGCTGRKLLSTNGSSLFLFLSEHWTERKGEEGICQIKKGSYKPPFCSCAPPAQAAKKKALLATPIQAVDGRSQKGRRTSPCFLLPLQQSPPSPGVVFGKGGRCRGDAVWGLISLCLWMVSELPAAGPVQKCQVMPLHGDFP